MFGRKKKNQFQRTMDELQKKWAEVDSFLDDNIKKMDETLALMEENQQLLNDILEYQEKSFEQQATLVIIEREIQNAEKVMGL